VVTRWVVSNTFIYEILGTCAVDNLSQQRHPNSEPHTHTHTHTHTHARAHTHMLHAAATTTAAAAAAAAVATAAGNVTQERVYLVGNIMWDVSTSDGHEAHHTHDKALQCSLNK
jgi:hypothetical protein